MRGHATTECKISPLAKTVEQQQAYLMMKWETKGNSYHRKM